MKRKVVSLILSVCMLVALLPPAAAASSRYTDIPGGHWSVEAVDAATEYGLMQGVGNGVFGFGRTITRAEFATVLCQMFDWKLVNSAAPSFSDVAESQWFYSYVETALAQDVIDSAAAFGPNDKITREEMAVMLVRALGYKTLAESAASFGNPFTDVTSNKGYITIASDIGMTAGTSATTFAPKQTAKREEAAAMLVRVYEKYMTETDWVHGFYAISSYPQRELTRDMDAVSVGWSRMSFDAERGAYLNTTTENNNEWNIPMAYEDIISYFKNNSTKTHLNVHMDASTIVTTASGSNTSICSVILLDGAKRTQAVDAILDEVTKDYSAIGYNPYSGVTINFEGMKGGALKEGFNSFLKELSEALNSINKTLYVTVQPVTSDGVYFDAYDYRRIGELADKVILMAHNYYETTMPENLLGSAYHRNTPVTPFASVYYSLRAITDKNTGVQDTSKIALAVSFSSVGWRIRDSKLVDTASVSPTPSTIYSRLKGGAEMGYSETYRNPYINYKTEDGTEIFLWYEDERSVNDKLQLAKLFGVDGASFWRLGLIPNYADEGLYYNVLESIR